MDGSIEVSLNHGVFALQPLDHAPGGTGTLPIGGEAIAALTALPGFSAFPWRPALTLHDGGSPLFVIGGG